MTHPADVQDILRQAAILVGKAEQLGVTLRITGEPLKPLAMGNQRHIIEAWPARERTDGCCGHPSNCQKDYRVCPHKGTPPIGRDELIDRVWTATLVNLREG